mmetsp:Transcript_29629/g.85929  ORF Transcript_29629/g.85929 Transcript_29629/m.85929 type:complete len:289 (+) Transcript_29629:1731-2597(+)
MRSQDNCGGVIGQVLLEPDAGAEVQVVCGFVEYEQRGFLKQGLGERDTHAPTAGHVLRGFRHHRLGEAQAVQERARLGLEGLRGHLVQLVAENFEDVLVALRVLLAERLDKGFDTLVLLLRDVDHTLQRGDIRRVRFLVHEPDVDVVRYRKLAGGDAGQERGLAAAVGADQPVAAAVVNADRRVLDQLLAEHGHRHLLDPNIAGLHARGEDAGDVHGVKYREPAAAFAEHHLLLLRLLGPLRRGLLLRRGLRGGLRGLLRPAHGCEVWLCPRRLAAASLRCVRPGKIA